MLLYIPLPAFPQDGEYSGYLGADANYVTLNFIAVENSEGL